MARCIGIVSAAAWAVLCWASAAAAGPTGASKNVQVELVPEVESVQPGTPLWVGIRLRMAPKWHTYWLNPGDSGLPTRMRWALPEGFAAEPFEWPTPEPIAAPPLVSYGYEGEVMLLSRITPPPTLAAGSEVTIGGRLDWLECKEACLPGRAQLDVTLPVRDAPPARAAAAAELFAAARAALPGDGASWTPRVHVSPQLVALSFQSPLTPRRATFLPETQGLIEYAPPQRLLRTADGYRLEMTPSTAPAAGEILAGVLVVQGEGGPVAVRVETRRETLTAALPAGQPIETGRAAEGAQALGLPLALALAFLGGMILNLMPCVLPVLSLKVMGFVRHAGDRGAAWRHGLAYTVGVLLSFWVLAGLLLLLRAGGQQVGWGFQLQSPPFVAFLACLFFAIGLNLFGVFEVGLSLTSAGGALHARSGLGSSLAGGVLATIVATPCTAPFMGSALGFGLSQPPAVSLLIFSALGLGMALPYLVLSLSPGLLRFVPKPGRWMETFKQFMGFLMMGTVVVLVWIFGQQVGIDGVTALLAGLVILASSAWIYGRGTAPEAGEGQRRAAYVLSAVLATAGLFVGFTRAGTSAAPASGATTVSGGIAWEEWSPEKVAAARAQGKPVFVDFTAAWCLSCQVNERVALGAAEVQERFRREGVVMLRADWTRRDDAITQALAAYGRNGVPLYVLYGRGKSEPHLLPEVISPGLVLDALDSHL
jgi:thiol:disulfide interchange protein DsbD